jgi:hypothetical protein
MLSMSMVFSLSCYFVVTSVGNGNLETRCCQMIDYVKTQLEGLWVPLSVGQEGKVVD